LTATQSKKVLAELLDHGGDPEKIAANLGFEAMADDAVGAAVDDVIATHPAEWQRYREGDSKVSGMLIGKVMALTKGKADGKTVGRLLQERRGS
jgi:aspartyl-tRNA(Asn)/glutamyl-tRNA(Gln) amidotransferase subunit B